MNALVNAKIKNAHLNLEDMSRRDLRMLLVLSTRLVVDEEDFRESYIRT